MKTADKVIDEITTEIIRLNAKGQHSFFGMGFELADGVPEEIERHFSNRDLGYIYAKVSPCGCAKNTYDIMIQFL